MINIMPTCLLVDYLSYTETIIIMFSIHKLEVVPQLSLSSFCEIRNISLLSNACFRGNYIQRKYGLFDFTGNIIETGLFVTSSTPMKYQVFVSYDLKCKHTLYSAVAVT